jgi:deoxycytidylate deaminase
MQQGIRVRVGAVIVRNGVVVLVEYDAAQEEDIFYQGLL